MSHDPGDILRELGAHAISIPLIPQGLVPVDGAVTYEAETRADAAFRLREAFIYSVDGRLDASDITIAAVDPKTELNATWTRPAIGGGVGVRAAQLSRRPERIARP